jgi:RND family efflux transporter MFP subunit
MLYGITNKLLFSCLLFVLTFTVTGCGNKSGQEQGPGKQGGAGASATEVIVDSVGQEDVQLYIYADGRTVPSNSVEIRARISGYLEKLFFDPGAIVKQGDQLALIEQAQYQVALDAAKADLANSKARAALAGANLDRAKTLFESKTISSEEYQTHQADRDMALATVELANTAVRNAELNLQYTDMRSPITGKTTKNLVDIGNYVSPSGTQAILLAVAQLDPMFIEFKLSDRQFSDLKDRIGFRDAFNKAVGTAKQADSDNTAEKPLALTGIPIDISLMTGMNVLDFDFNVSGKIVALVDNQINFETGQITLRGEVRNPLLQTSGTEDYMLYPGQICRVRIPYENVKGAVLIREEAILTDLDTKYVFTVGKGMFEPKDAFGKPLKDKDGKPAAAYETDIVYRRDIKIGRLLDSQMRMVLSGLNPNEAYIVKGMQRARVGMEVKPVTLKEYNALHAAETAQ